MGHFTVTEGALAVTNSLKDLSNFPCKCQILNLLGLLGQETNRRYNVSIRVTREKRNLHSRSYDTIQNLLIMLRLEFYIMFISQNMLGEMFVS